MYLLFAWRYFKAKKSTNAINIIAWVSVVAIAFATTALLVIWSAFNGFEDLVKSLYSTFYTNVKITGATGKTLEISPDQLDALKRVPGVYALSCNAEERALIQNGDYKAIVSLKGVDSNYSKVTALHNTLIRGQFEMGDEENPGVVLGAGVENVLGLLSDRSIGQLTVFVPRRGQNISDPLSAFSEGNLTPFGSFAVEQDFDNNYVLTNLDFVKTYLNLKENEYSAIEIATLPNYKDDDVKASISILLGSGYTVKTRYEQNSSLYNIITLEKVAIFGIFILVLIVAAFNMIGALSMLVLEKQKDIQILQSMGAYTGWIRKVFLSEGVLLATIGCAAGIVLAIVICLAQVYFKIVPLEGNSFLIDYYPVKMVFSDFVIVAITVFIIAIAASFIPASRAARQSFELKN